MNNRYIITILLFCAFFISSCSSVSRTYEKTVKITDIDVPKQEEKGTVKINDTEMEKNGSITPTVGESKKEVNQTMKDGSEITTMHDGYGNTVQTRYFYNHPNLTVLSIKTRADGEKEGIAFGHNGEKKKLSSEAISQGFTASGSEITNLVGITTTKLRPSEKPLITNNNPPAAYPKPMPVYPNSSRTTEAQSTEPQTDQSNSDKSEPNEKDKIQVSRTKENKE